MTPSMSTLKHHLAPSMTERLIVHICKALLQDSEDFSPLLTNFQVKAILEIVIKRPDNKVDQRSDFS